MSAVREPPWLLHLILMVSMSALAGNFYGECNYFLAGFCLGFAAVNWKFFTHAWDRAMK